MQEDIEQHLSLEGDEEVKTAIGFACGRSHTLLLSTLYEAYAFGSNVKGQLGVGEAVEDSKSSVSEARRVKIPDGTKIKKVAAGERHSLFLSVDGFVYVCGTSDKGQLGTGKAAKYFEPIRLPKIVGAIDIACGPDYSAIVAATRGSIKAEMGVDIHEGELWTFGCCESGKLGHPDLTTDNILEPKKVQLKQLVTKIACGESHMLAILANSEIMGWGAGSHGRLGNGGTGNCYSPQLVRVPPGHQYIDVMAGATHSMALTKGGVVFVWGYSKAVCAPMDIMTPQNFTMQLDFGQGAPTISQIFCGPNISGVVTSMGKLYFWGENKSHVLDPNGQLVNQRDDWVISPAALQEFEAVDSVAVGIDHIVVSTRKGEIFTWGNSERGKLGVDEHGRRVIDEPTKLLVTWPFRDPNSVDVNHILRLRHKSTRYEAGPDDVMQEVFKEPDPDLGVLQNALKNEPEMFGEQRLREVEEAMTTVYSKLLGSLQLLKSRQAHLERLRDLYASRLTRYSLFTGVRLPYFAK